MQGMYDGIGDRGTSKDVPEKTARDDKKEDDSVWPQNHGEACGATREDKCRNVARTRELSGDGSINCIDAKGHGKDRKRFSHADAVVDRGERAEHGKCEGDERAARAEVAAHKAGEQNAAGEIHDNLENIDSIEPGVRPDAREKLLEDREKDGIAGKAEERGIEGGTVGHPVYAVMEEIVAELEVVCGVIVAGARKNDEDEPKRGAHGDPDPPAARPARWMDAKGHEWRIQEGSESAR